MTIANSTISNNTGSFIGGGLRNSYGSATVTNSTISGNGAIYAGGVDSSYEPGVFTISNSTVSGNSASGNGVLYYGGGGGISSGGILVVSNSTITGNQSNSIGGGVHFNRGPGLTLAHTLLSGNTAPIGSEVFNSLYVTVVADHNLFDANGNAGVEGFTPGLTDVVPPTGVQLSNILNPVLAFNGGRRKPMRSSPVAWPLMQATPCVRMPPAPPLPPISGASPVSWMATATARPRVISARLNSSPSSTTS
jgi:hypothetical protein